MTRQWIRKVNLTVGNGSSAIDLSNMRIRFTVQQVTVQTPGSANIIVTNLSDQTADAIQKEYTNVTLDAGYEGNVATIFKGEIFQKRKGRENPTDTFLAILATESQAAYSYSVISKSLAAGHTFRDQVDACLDALKPYGITAGHIADLGTATMPTGKSLFGAVRNQLRAICQSTGTSWSIQQGKLNILKNDETLPGEVVVLNSRTGLIGLPVQTFNGIEARCLLNPRIKAGAMIQIDQKSVQQQEFSVAYSQQGNNSLIPEVATDGYYKVIAVTHSGDTRGNEFYTDIICLSSSGGAIRGIIPQNISQTYLSVDL